MSKLDEIKSSSEKLSSEEFVEIFRWLAKKEWDRWDKEIEDDSQAGKLDFLVSEARAQKAKGNLDDL
jgi:hypothetical protein